MIASSIVGPAPVIDYSHYYTPVPVIGNESAGNVTVIRPPPRPNTIIVRPTIGQYNDRLQQVQSEVSNILSVFSPIDSFSGYLGYGHMGIGPAMITRQNTYAYMYGPATGMASSGEEMSLLDSLASVWMRVLILIAEIIAAFGIAYLAFMRTDIR